jgi:chromosome segregation ATPase
MVREITDAEKEIRKLQQEEEVLKEENQNMVEEMKETRKMCEMADQQLLKAVEEIEKVLISQIDLGGSLKLREELNSCQREAERLRKDKLALEQEIENRLKNTEKKIKQKSMEEELLRIDYQNALASTVYQQGILPLINEPKETKKEAEKENQAGGPGWTFDRLARKEKGSESLKTRNNGTGKGTIATKDKRVKKNECQESLVMDLDMFGGKFA